MQASAREALMFGLSSPRRVALAVGLACLCFVLLRLAVNHFDPTVFVMAGDH